MIGDLVTFEDCQHDEHPIVVKIWQINGDNDAFVSINENDALDEITIDDEIVGIPLTPEILEKNGFKKLDFSHYQINDRTLVLDADGKWEGPLSWHWVVTEMMDTNQRGQSVVLDYYVATINYVHELQHALKLCGIEKEIVL